MLLLGLALPASVWAAFPQVAAQGGSEQTSDTTSHTVAIGSPSAGDLVLVQFGVDGVTAPTWPMGWTVIDEDTNNSEHISLAYKVAAGGEGASITVTSGFSDESQHQYWRITGHDSGQAPQGSCTAATSAQTTIDPPSVTPTGGAKDYLWFAFGLFDSNVTWTAGWPASYVSTGEDISGGSSAPGITWARRELNAASEDPGTFTLGVSGLQTGCTVAVHPGAASGLLLRRRRD